MSEIRFEVKKKSLKKTNLEVKNGKVLLEKKEFLPEQEKICLPLDKDKYDCRITEKELPDEDEEEEEEDETAELDV